MYATRSSFVSLFAVAVFASSATAATTREAREEGPDRAAATRNRAESSRRRRSFDAPGGARARAGAARADSIADEAGRAMRRGTGGGGDARCAEGRGSGGDARSLSEDGARRGVVGEDVRRTRE